jgi:polysaccharide biosynthesis protein PslG
MKRALAAAAVLALAIAVLAAPAGGRTGALPRGFFGVVPQTALTPTDAKYMRAGGIGSIRVPVMWSLIQPSAKGDYDWSGLDQAVEVASGAGLTVLPFLYSTPTWLAPEPTALPIDSGKARRAWVAFVKAAVQRYGPGGEFWTQHAPEQAAINYVPAIPRPMPIREWQVWNEANFFYFAYPVSPARYVRLLKLTHGAIKSADPGAKVILSGLFGDPNEGGKRGMPAAKFLEAIYRVPGVKADFDAVALHPYAFHVEDLEELVEEIRAISLENHDPGAALYITEMGWGSQNDPNRVAFEQGVQGQARELRGAYRYLIENRFRLNLKGAYWFSWKDVPRGACNFCDSVGLFRAGPRFRPKPAWHSFVALSGGRARP